jgi:hypothetical protein
VTNDDNTKTTRMTKEQLMAEIKDCAERLGYAPSLAELAKNSNVRTCDVRRHFETYGAAIRACGLERKGSGYDLRLEEIFRNWATVVRKLGKVPSVAEYQTHGNQCARPAMRCFGVWAHVAAGMLKYARDSRLESEWSDVLELTAEHLAAGGGKARNSTRTGLPIQPHPRILEGEPIYGPPNVESPLLLAPSNEQEVILVFGAVARKLGFAILKLQTQFPDGEALREMEPGRWQRIRIEFEYESRNFLRHGHTAEKCHVIVCWRHNWPECPVEVIELSRLAADLW